MIGLRSFRARLVLTMILLVVLSIATVGIGSYLLVSRSLIDELVSGATARADFNIGVVADEAALPAGADAAALAVSELPTAFLVGGSAGVYVDFGSGQAPYASSSLLLETPNLVSAGLRELVDDGELAYEFVNLSGRRSLVVAGRRPPGGPDFYFFSSAATLDSTLRTLRQVLLAGSAALVVVGAAVAALIARRALRPVAEASRAAQQMARGDLAVRVPVESGDEFGRWAESFNQMAAALQAKVDELEAAQARERRFVADVSHELRTPLTALVNEAGLLREHLDEMPTGSRRVAELLVADVDRLRRLVEDLLEISRLEAGADQTGTDEFAPEPFLGAVVAARLPAARLRVSAPSVIGADRRGIERILGNLLDNAATHAAGADVEVEARVEDGVLRLIVADRGPGVPEDKLAHLFDRFFKADEARVGSGTGLGLAIARQHARRLGGDVVAELRTGGGMVFAASLPVTGLLPDGDAGGTGLPHPVMEESP